MRQCFTKFMLTKDSYFKPKYIQGLGLLQDGGLLFNNPASIALRETAALFPAAPQPSLVVSLGTGHACGEDVGVASRLRLWRDSFPVRIFRAFWQYGSPARAWQQLLSHHKVDSSGEFFRFDIEFPGPEPPLDGVADMEEIGYMARSAIQKSPTLERLVACMRAELFLFELDVNSRFQCVDGEYECSGRILCRLPAGTPTFEALMLQLDKAGASFQIDGRTTRCGGFRRYSATNPDEKFYRCIRFRVRGRQTPFTITLNNSYSDGHNISGSPFSLERLIEAQKLETWFGWADHRKRPLTGRPDDDSRRKRRRLV